MDSLYNYLNQLTIPEDSPPSLGWTGHSPIKRPTPPGTPPIRPHWGCLLLLLSWLALPQPNLWAQACPSGGTDITVTGSTAKLPAAPPGSHWRSNGGNTATIDDQGNITGLTADGNYSFLLVTSGTTCGAPNTLTEGIYSDYFSAAFGGQFAIVGNPIPGQGYPITSFGTLADASTKAEPGLYGPNADNTLIFQIADRTIHYANGANTYASGTTYKMTVSYNPVTDLLTYAINNQLLSFHPKAVNVNWPTGNFMSATMLYLSSSAVGQKVEITNIKLNGTLLQHNSLVAENAVSVLDVSGYDYYNGYTITADVTYTYSGTPAPGDLFFDYKFGQTSGCSSGDNGCVDEVIVTKSTPACVEPSVGTPLVTLASCTAGGTSANADGSIVVPVLTNASSYGFTTDGSTPVYTPTQSITGGVVSLTGLANPVSPTTYSIRVFNGSASCFTDVTALLTPRICTPVCALATTATPGSCNPATNQYSMSGTISLTNAVAGTATITDGSSTTTVSIAAGAPAVTYSLAGLTSGTGSHTVTVSLPGCGTAMATYSAPASCTVAPCGLAMTLAPGLCQLATNSYVLSGTITASNVPTSGTLTISSGAFSPRSLTLPVGNASGTFSYSGLVSNGQTYTVTATYSDGACSPVSKTYTAPASCSVAPVCSMSAVTTAGLCQTATNTYSATVVVSLSNAPAGTITVSLPGASPISQTLAANTGTFTAVVNGLISDGASHTTTVSLPGCGTTTATFTAPASCSVAPVCSISAVATAGLCQTATNTYSSTVVVTVRNPSAGTLSVSDGAQTLTFSTTANAQNTFTAVFNGLPSNGTTHTVTASLPGCSSATTTYTAPASCSIAPVCSISAVATAGPCQTATNTYSSTVVVTVKNPSSGIITIGDGAQTQTFSTTASAQNTFTVVFPALLSSGANHTVTASLPGCSSATTTYTAPASCSVTPICNLSLTASGAHCNPTTNLYVLAGTITLTNSPTSQTLTLTDGSYMRSLTAAAGTTTINYSYTTLQSDGAIHTVNLTSSSCGTASTTYTAPASCTVAPVCSLSAVATAGICASATSTYSNTVLVTLTNPTAGTMTVTNGVNSITFVMAASVGTTTTSAIFNGLPADGASHMVTVSLPGCGTTTATYTAPASCSTTPGCSVSLTSNSLPTGQVGQAYSATLTANGGTAPYSFSLVGGTLPAGLTLSSSGMISGTPTVAGSFSTTIRITDSKNCSVIVPIMVLQIELAPSCSFTATATPGQCSVATNTYNVNGTIRLSNNTNGGTILLRDGGSLLSLSVASGTTSVPYSLTGLVSDGALHTVVATLSGCGTTSVSYTAPGSCTQPVGVKLVLDKRVNKSKAKLEDILTYTLVLTNTGTNTANNVVVTDSSTAGLNYVANSATAPAGTTFTQGTPISTWLIGSITAGQSLSLTFQAKADSSGILYNKAYIPGDTVTVCTSVPVIVCSGDIYLFQLTAPAGRSSYRWFKDNVEIPAQTTNVLNVTAPGTYSLAIDNVSGKCPDFSCCPFIVEEDTLPTFRALAVPVTCIGNAPQANGRIELSGFNPAYSYQYSLGSSFNKAASLSGSPRTIPAGGVIVSNLVNPVVAQAYTVRVYNGSGCYTDVTVMLMPTVCGCPAEVCVPFVIKQTKRIRRQGL